MAAKYPSGDKIRIKELEAQVTQLQWCVAELHFVTQRLAQYVTLQALEPALRERMAAQAQNAMIARTLTPAQ